MASSPTTPEKRAALSRDLSEFLVELSIGVHRYAMYPPGHPSLGPAVDNVVRRLDDLLVDRPSLSIGVADRQLVIEGLATDRKHPVLSDLARRLHEHQIGALSFERGATPEEVSGLLEALALEQSDDELPLGLRPHAELPTWKHAALRPLGYDGLELREEGDGEEAFERATGLWLGLARAALSQDELADRVPEGPELARAIEGRERDSDYDQVIAGYLRQLTQELTTAEGKESEAVRHRVSSLLGQLDEGTLERLVGLGSGTDQERSFLLDANQSLAVDAVLKVVRAAAESSGQTISDSMVRLLSKLARHAEGGRSRMRARADDALRENVERLISSWELADPNPDAYTGVLDAMARSAPVFEEARARDEAPAGPIRILQTAMEIDAWGPMVGRALTEALEAPEGTRTVLGLLDDPPGERVAEEILARLREPVVLRRVVGEHRLEEGELRALVARVGSAVVEPMLDVLVESDDRGVRRMVFDVLAGMGPGVAGPVRARLQGEERWFVLRNMLALLAGLHAPPDDFDPWPWLEHPDARVRREALPLALRGDARERALAAALSDPDERMARMGLAALAGETPDALVPILVDRVVRGEGRSPDLRAAAVRALRGARVSLARTALLELAVTGRTLFGKPRLATGPVALAALRVLASTWAGHPEADPVLERAAGSREETVRQAVEEAT